MAEGNNSSNTTILVAGIGALASIAVGVFANFDKIRGTATASPSPSVAASAAASSSAVADIPNISGTWNDGDIDQIQFTQEGKVFIFTHTIEGKEYAGTGELDGRKLDFRYNVVEGEEQWNCKAEVAVGDTAITGNCTSANTDSWGIRFVYQT